MSEQPKAYYRATLEQHGAQITCIVDEKGQEAIFKSVHHTGEPFQVWVTYKQQQGARMICIDPAAGGLSYSMFPAGPIPVHPQDGSALTAEGVQALRSQGAQESIVRPDNPAYPGLISLAQVVPMRFPSLSQRLSATLAMLVENLDGDAPLELTESPHTPPASTPAAAAN
jgi:hypothetical protein